MRCSDREFGPSRRSCSSPFFAVVRAQLAAERVPPRGRDRPRKVQTDPALPSLDVAAPASTLQQVEMQKRLAADVKDAGLVFLDPGPASHFGEYVVEIVEQLGRAVRHRFALTPGDRSPGSGRGI